MERVQIRSDPFNPFHPRSHRQTDQSASNQPGQKQITAIFDEKSYFSDEPSVKPDFYKLFPKLAALFTNFANPILLFWDT